MIDFIKLQITDFDCRILESNPVLSFQENFNSHTGEITPINQDNENKLYCKIAQYNGLTFKIYSNNTIYISGSAHKYFNNGIHNYNRFSFVSFCKTLDSIKNTFNLDFTKCVIKCLEIGINTKINFCVDEVLHNVIMHKKQLFEAKYLNKMGHYKQCLHSDYIIKIYNKTKQYRALNFDVDDNILRFEIKYRKMRKINDLGIYTLNDFLNFDFKVFKDLLLSEFDAVFIYDFTLQFHHKKDFKNKYSNSNFWRELINEPKPNKYKHHFNYYTRELNKHPVTLKEQLKNLINNEIDICLLKPPISPFIYKVNKECKKKCVITGLDISMQKSHSKLLSHTGLMYYLINDSKTYNLIKNKYLSKKWMYADLNTEIKEIAHNIRTRLKNQIYRYKLLDVNQTNLLLN